MEIFDLVHVLGAAQWLPATLALSLAAWNVAPSWLPVDAAAPRADRRVERALRAVLLTFLGMALSVAVLGAFGLLASPGILLFALLAWALSTRLPAAAVASEPRSDAGDGASESGIPFWPWWIASAAVAADAGLYLLVPPTNWDAMTYHLYLPARWIQEGRLVHVPTVFADAHAAYAPQNGALVFAWQMALTGFDTLCNVVQRLLLLFGAVLLARTARELSPDRAVVRAGVPAFALAGTLFVFLAPAREWALTANVDVFLTVFWLASVHWGVRAVRRGETSSLLASGLALGLAAGTKWAGVLLAAVPVLLVAAAAFRHRRWAGAAGAAGLSVLGGGWWYLRNLHLYDNPLFPLDFEVLGLHFHGAFRSEAMATSFLRLEPGVWWRSLPIAFGWPTCAVALAGVGGLLSVLLGRRRSRGERGSTLAVLLFVGAWTTYCVAILPYNSQFRFLLPALAASCLGWVPIFRALARMGARRGPSLAAACWIAASACLLLASPAGEIWRRPLAVLSRAAMSGWAWTLPATCVLLALLAFWVVRRWPGCGDRSRLVGVGTAGIGLGLLGLVAVGGTVADGVRGGFLATAEYRFQALGLLPFQDAEQAPLDVAYSGMNVPYALMGPGFRHRVIYVDTGASEDDEFYDYWRHQRARGGGFYDSHKPGIYRGADDRPEPWLERLRREEIDAVVLFRLVPVELPSHWPLDGEFPIERRWVRDARKGRSESRSGLGFRPLLVSDVAEIYLVDADVSATPASE